MPPDDSVGRDHLVGHLPSPRRSLFRLVGGKSLRLSSCNVNESELTLLIPLHPAPRRPQARGEDVAPLTEVEHLLVVAGNSDEENPYRKGSAIQVSDIPLGK